MTNRTALVESFTAIYTLGTKIDANQQKVNFMHYMHGRADDAFHFQGMVDSQRVRLTAMRAEFEAMTAGLTQQEINAIKMAVFNREIERAAA